MSARCATAARTSVSAPTSRRRAAVKAFQTEAFRRKAELLPGFEAFCRQKGYTFRIPVEEVFDYCVLEFGFSYWQWGQEVSVLPAADAPAACND